MMTHTPDLSLSMKYKCHESAVLWKGFFEGYQNGIERPRPI